MDFTGKQLLVFMILEHGVLLYLVIKYGYPLIKKMADQVGENTANQAVLCDNDNRLMAEISMARTFSREARDHCADIKQEISKQTAHSGVG